MRTKFLIVMVVLGLAVAGVFAYGTSVVRGGVPHTVDGPVGPGVAPGPTNPANYASATFYLLNKPAETPQVQPQLIAADGTNAAYYGWDVGSLWSWAAGDTVIVVAETVRGTNGWANVNYTASSNGVLTNGNVDSLPNANIEALPTVTLVKSSTFIDVRWTGLTDNNNNVRNYTVERWTTANPSWNVIGRSGPQAAGGAMDYNDTTIAGVQQQYCYRILANYRSGVASGFYMGVGTSEWACATILQSPMISSTTPANGASNVAVTANIVVNFDMQMNPGTVTQTISPAVVLVQGWNAGFTVLTLTHAAAFAQCTEYTVTVSGQATNGMPLAPNPAAPNPWTFNTTCPITTIVSTVPANLATGVPQNADIVVTFSQAMVTTSVTITTVPAYTFTTAWSGGNTIATFNHTTAFTACQPISVTIAGQNLQPNPNVPNPWSFTANCAPTVAVTAPAAGVDWTGGSGHPINWTMSDETPSANLRIRLNYTTAGTPHAITTLTGVTTYAWTVPNTVNAADVVVTADVMDAAGVVTRASSGQFTIDSTAPTVSSTNPLANDVGVGTDQVITITFSEAMNHTLTQGAFSISPTVAVSGFSWSGNTLTVAHTVAFTMNTPYTVTIATTAVDVSDPGNALASAFVLTFTTGGLTPNAPTLNPVSNAQATSLDLSWTAPTQYTNGFALQAGNITGYRLYRTTDRNQAEPWTEITPTGGIAGTATSITDSGLTTNQEYCYYIRAVTGTGATLGTSSPSTHQCGTTTASVAAPDYTWLYILIIIIIVVIVIALIAWSRRKKPEAAPPEEAAAPAAEEAAPAAPAEEATPPEEGTGETGGAGGTGGEGGSGSA